MDQPQQLTEKFRNIELKVANSQSHIRTITQRSEFEGITKGLFCIYE